MLYDISPPIDDRLKVWPGDPGPEREVLRSIEQGDHSTLSALHSTVHLGAHVDAPNHVAAGKQSIDLRDLDTYWGLCQVFRVEVGRGERILPAMLPGPIEQPRVLLATGTYPDPATFNIDFAGLSVELVDYLHESGVLLVGLDTPSVDPYAIDGMPAHRRCVEHDIAILEGLVLADVPPGCYELAALPLKLVGFDGSPVRAALRTV